MARPVKTSVLPVEAIDTRFLESVLGYNVRRASLSIIELFMQRMAPYGLGPVDFSVLSLVGDNPGITSRQLCATLNILPPNLVGLVNTLEKRELIERLPHPHDGRAVGLHPTEIGRKLLRKAQTTACNLEIEATAKLSATQRKTLMRLLQKIYL